MNFNKFYGISNENILNANKVAMRLIDLIKDRTNKQDIRQIQFHLIELHSIIYGSSKDSEIVYHCIKECINSLQNCEINILNKNHSLYANFWNTLITSSKNGNICNTKDFMKNLRMKFGQDNQLIYFFNLLVEELYPDYSECELKTYVFHFVSYNNSIFIKFKARIKENEITFLLDNLKKYNINNYEDKIKQFLENHHLEYSDLEIFQKEVLFEDLEKLYKTCVYYCRWDNDILDLMNTIKCDEYYICITISKKYDDWYKAYLLTTKIQRIKKSNRFIVKSITQNYDIDDDDLEQRGKFIIQKYTTYTDGDFDKEINLNEIVIPEYSGKEIEILKNIDNINNINDIKTILN